MAPDCASVLVQFLQLCITCRFAIQTLGLAMAVKHSDMVKLRFPGPVFHVVPQERPDEHPGHRTADHRTYGVFRTLHFAAEAIQTLSSPQRPPLFVFYDVFCRADVDAFSTRGAFVRIHFEQAAVEVFDQPPAHHAPLQPIREWRIWFLFRRYTLSFGGTGRNISAERSRTFEFMRRWMIRRKKIPLLQVPQKVGRAITVKIPNVYRSAPHDEMS